jgi:hypothetical protein
MTLKRRNTSASWLTTSRLQSSSLSNSDLSYGPDAGRRPLGGPHRGARRRPGRYRDAADPRRPRGESALSVSNATGINSGAMAGVARDENRSCITKMAPRKLSVAGDLHLVWLSKRAKAPSLAPARYPLGANCSARSRGCVKNQRPAHDDLNFEAQHMLGLFFEETARRGAGHLGRVPPSDKRVRRALRDARTVRGIATTRFLRAQS